MKTVLFGLLRVVITLVVVVFAMQFGWDLWVEYQVSPWTRDGKVRIDPVQVAPDVSGPVVAIRVREEQPVKQGDVLVEIDPSRFQLAVTQAEDAIAAQMVALAQAEREDRRNRALGALVTAEAVEEGASKVAQLKAAIAVAQDALAVAQLNLARTEIRAPVDGVASEFLLRVGDYAVQGKPMLAVIDPATVHVDGYFEETKLRRIAVGDTVSVQLMGEDVRIRGHVEAIAPAIHDRERTGAGGFVPDINPTFSWVRLAQRIPVRIVLDEAPEGVRLVAGRTATVIDTVRRPLPKAPWTRWKLFAWFGGAK